MIYAPTHIYIYSIRAHTREGAVYIVCIYTFRNVYANTIMYIIGVVQYNITASRYGAIVYILYHRNTYLYV